MDTIFALATAPGKSGVAIIRLSGPRAWEAVRQLAGSLPAPRVAGLRKLTGAAGHLDEALVLVFEAGSSFTGEAVAELHLHGSTAVIASVLSELAISPVCGRQNRENSPGVRWKMGVSIFPRWRGWRT